MKLKYESLYLIILILFPLKILSQTLNGQAVNLELDPILYNGKLYNYSVTKQIKGNPFLFETQNQNGYDKFVVGNIKLKGRLFQNLLINYDIYHQKLLVKFDSPQSGAKIIEVSDAWLQSFSANNKYFVYTKDASGDLKIFQYLGNSDIQIYYFWSKRLEMRASVNDSYYFFTHAQKEMFLKKKKEMYKFTNNRNYIKLFGKDLNKKIKTYLKQNKIRIKKCSDKKMLELINFCNSL